MRKRLIVTGLALKLALLIQVSAAVPATPSAPERNIVTLGGDGDRNHFYRTVLPAALCVEQQVKTGRTLSQPLILHYPNGIKGPDGKTHHDIVFHLGQTDLKVLTLNGDEIASHWVQNAVPNSLQQMTYARRRLPNGQEMDVLYVGIRPPGIKAYAVEALLAANSGAEPLGEVSFEGADQVVAAPLYVGETDWGQDLVAIPAVPDRFYVLQGLATGNPLYIKAPDDARGWNSATPTRVGVGQFAVTLGSQMSIYRLYQLPALQLVMITGTPPIPLGAQALSQLVREQTSGLGSPVLYTAEKHGILHKLDFSTSGHEQVTPRTFQGFINTGPSTDGEQVYFGFRWAGSTTATTPGGPHGLLVAVDKSTWQIAWERPIPTLGGSHDKSWINITPIVWRSSHDNARRIIAGDARGGLTALTSEGEPGPLFLTGHGHLPLACEAVEQTDPAYRPSFRYAHQTLLTDRPYTTAGANAWHNTQGVAAEMSIYKGHLFAGYNHVNPADSALVIFRPATNIAVGALRVERKEADGSYRPVAPADLVKPGTQVRVTAPVTYQADPAGGPRPITLWAGFHGGPRVEVTETMQPFERRDLTFELTVPAGQGDALLSVTANPALYIARRAHEAGRDLPPGVAEIPPPLPAEWGSGGAIPVGEVWALDNTRSLALPRTTRNDCHLVDLSVPSLVIADQFRFSVSVAYYSHLKPETEGQITVTATPAGGGDPTTLFAPVTLTANAPPQQVPGSYTEVPPGTYHLVARLTCPDDTRPGNDQQEASVTVERPQSSGDPGYGSSNR